jgi:peroxiredoxin
MDKEELPWRSFADKGAIAAWNAATPTYYVIDHQGLIRHKWVGRPGPGERAIDAALEPLIQQAERDAKTQPK